MQGGLWKPGCGGEARVINKYLTDFQPSQDLTQGYFIVESYVESRLKRGYNKYRLFSFCGTSSAKW